MAKKCASYLYELNKFIGGRGRNEGPKVVVEERGYNDGQLRMHTLPSAAQCDDDDEYENVELDTLSSTKQQTQSAQYENVLEGQATKLSSDAENDDGLIKIFKKNKEYIAIGIFLTVLAVIAIIVLAVGALSLSESSKVQISIDALEEGTMNYTSYLLDEIRALKSQYADIQSNISQLMSQLSSQHEKITCSLFLSVSRLCTSTISPSLTDSELNASIIQCFASCC